MAGFGVRRFIGALLFTVKRHRRQSGDESPHSKPGSGASDTFKVPSKSDP